MSCFQGHMKEYETISLDRFDGKNLRSTVYFLSHLHEDHTEGLAAPLFHRRLKSNRGIFLYCSDVTKILIEASTKYKHLAPYVKTIAINTPTIITVPDFLFDEEDTVTVTLLPAFHCPGSVMCLFEGKEGTVLYTGDFRWEHLDLEQMHHLRSGDSVKKVQSVYIDTTFCVEENMYIPSRQQCIDAVYHLVNEWTSQSTQHVVYFFLRAQYGHEPLLNAVASRLKMPVHVSHHKEEVYDNIAELHGNFTSDGTVTQLHACPKNMLVTVEGDRKCPCRMTHDDDKVLMILPTTMYFTQFQHLTLDKIIRRMDANFYRACYSFHSSYTEIKDLLAYLKPENVYPNVKPPRDKDLQQTQHRLSAMLAECCAKDTEEVTLSDLQMEVKQLGTLKSHKARTRNTRRQSSKSDAESLDFGSPAKMSRLEKSLSQGSNISNKKKQKVVDSLSQSSRKSARTIAAATDQDDAVTPQKRSLERSVTPDLFLTPTKSDVTEHSSYTGSHLDENEMDLSLCSQHSLESKDTGELPSWSGGSFLAAVQSSTELDNCVLVDEDGQQMPDIVDLLLCSDEDDEKEIDSSCSSRGLGRRAKKNANIKEKQSKPKLSLISDDEGEILKISGTSQRCTRQGTSHTNPRTHPTPGQSVSHSLVSSDNVTKASMLTTSTGKTSSTDNVIVIPSKASKDQKEANSHATPFRGKVREMKGDRAGGNKNVTSAKRRLEHDVETDDIETGIDKPTPRKTSKRTTTGHKLVEKTPVDFIDMTEEEDNNIEIERSKHKTEVFERTTAEKETKQPLKNESKNSRKIPLIEKESKQNVREISLIGSDEDLILKEKLVDQKKKIKIILKSTETEVATKGHEKPCEKTRKPIFVKNEKEQKLVKDTFKEDQLATDKHVNNESIHLQNTKAGRPKKIEATVDPDNTPTKTGRMKKKKNKPETDSNVKESLKSHPLKETRDRKSGKRLADSKTEEKTRSIFPKPSSSSAAERDSFEEGSDAEDDEFVVIDEYEVDSLYSDDSFDNREEIHIDLTTKEVEELDDCDVASGKKVSSSKVPQKIKFSFKSAETKDKPIHKVKEANNEIDEPFKEAKVKEVKKLMFFRSRSFDILDDQEDLGEFGFFKPVLSSSEAPSQDMYFNKWAFCFEKYQENEVKAEIQIKENIDTSSETEKEVSEVDSEKRETLEAAMQKVVKTPVSDIENSLKHEIVNKLPAKSQAKSRRPIFVRDHNKQVQVNTTSREKRLKDNAVTEIVECINPEISGTDREALEVNMETKNEDKVDTVDLSFTRKVEASDSNSDGNGVLEQSKGKSVTFTSDVKSFTYTSDIIEPDRIDNVKDITTEDTIASLDSKKTESVLTPEVTGNINSNNDKDTDKAVIVGSSDEEECSLIKLIDDTDQVETKVTSVIEVEDSDCSQEWLSCTRATTKQTQHQDIQMVGDSTPDVILLHSDTEDNVGGEMETKKVDSLLTVSTDYAKHASECIVNENSAREVIVPTDKKTEVVINTLEDCQDDDDDLRCVAIENKVVVINTTENRQDSDDDLESFEPVDEKTGESTDTNVDKIHKKKIELSAENDINMYNEMNSVPGVNPVNLSEALSKKEKEEREELKRQAMGFVCETDSDSESDYTNQTKSPTGSLIYDEYIELSSDSDNEGNKHTKQSKSAKSNEDADAEDRKQARAGKGQRTDDSISKDSSGWLSSKKPARESRASYRSDESDDEVRVHRRPRNITTKSASSEDEGLYTESPPSQEPVPSYVDQVKDGMSNILVVHSEDSTSETLGQTKTKRNYRKHHQSPERDGAGSTQENIAPILGKSIEVRNTNRQNRSNTTFQNNQTVGSQFKLSNPSNFSAHTYRPAAPSHVSIPPVPNYPTVSAWVSSSISQHGSSVPAYPRIPPPMHVPMSPYVPQHALPYANFPFPAPVVNPSATPPVVPGVQLQSNLRSGIPFVQSSSPSLTISGSPSTSSILTYSSTSQWTSFQPSKAKDFVKTTNRSEQANVSFSNLKASIQAVTGLKFSQSSSSPLSSSALKSSEAEPVVQVKKEELNQLVNQLNEVKHLLEEATSQKFKQEVSDERSRRRSRSGSERSERDLYDEKRKRFMKERHHWSVQDKEREWELYYREMKERDQRHDSPYPDEARYHRHRYSERDGLRPSPTLRRHDDDYHDRYSRYDEYPPPPRRSRSEEEEYMLHRAPRYDRDRDYSDQRCSKDRPTPGKYEDVYPLPRREEDDYRLRRAEDDLANRKRHGGERSDQRYDHYDRPRRSVDDYGKSEDDYRARGYYTWKRGETYPPSRSSRGEHIPVPHPDGYRASPRLDYPTSYRYHDEDFASPPPSRRHSDTRRYEENVQVPSSWDYHHGEDNSREDLQATQDQKLDELHSTAMDAVKPRLTLDSFYSKHAVEKKPLVTRVVSRSGKIVSVTSAPTATVTQSPQTTVAESHHQEEGEDNSKPAYLTGITRAFNRRR